MHSIDLILLLASAFTLAAVCGYLTNRAGLSPIVGYLFAGCSMGPYTPGFVADQHLAEQLAEVGVILLMFGVGLQFHLDELLAVKKIAIPGAIVQSMVATGLGVLVARVAGWPVSSGIVFGIALSVASTVVLVRILADNRHLHTKAGQIAVGWLVVEDLFTVVVLVLLPAAAGGSTASIALTVVIAVLKIGVLAVFTMTAGGHADPAAARSRGADAVARAVHAHGAGPGAGHRGGRRQAVRRLDGARRLPGGDGRRPLGVQRARRLGRAADARRLRGAVLRVGRHAARPAVPAARARADCADARGRHRRETARRTR